MQSESILLVIAQMYNALLKSGQFKSADTEKYALAMKEFITAAQTILDNVNTVPDPHNSHLNRKH